MQAIFTPHRYRRHLVLVGSTLILGIFGTLFIRATQAHADSVISSEHIITVHDNGVDKGFITKRTTLREALAEEKITVGSKDRTEPSLDETLTSNSYQVNIYRARPVVIRDGSANTRVVTSYRTARQIASEAQVVLHDEDVAVLTASRDPLSDGAAEVMTITRATPFTFVFYGKVEQAFTMGTTIGQMLKEKNITMLAVDGVSPGVTMAMTSGMTVKLWRNGVQTATIDEPVPFTTNQIEDSDKPVGYKHVQQTGVDGARTATYEITMQNGVETARTEINSVTTQQAIEQIEIIGTKVELPPGSHEDWMASAGIAASDYGYVNYIVGRESGWSTTKYNYAGSGAYGLCQSLPASKMASAGGDYMTNPITQLKWCNSYAVGRYGSWAAAYDFWITRHWW